MKAVLRKENMPSSASKSLIPRPHTAGKKMKAKPAPDFSKLHKKWEEQLQTAKSCKKKPPTVVQPFDVTKPGTKFTAQTKIPVLNDVDDFDFEGDQKALDNILQSRGLSERKVVGKTTMETLSMSTGKIKSKSCTNLGKRRILGELPCDPDQLTDDRVVTAKKALEFEDATSTTAVEFTKDPEALQSILTDKGITAGTTDNRQTFSGSVCRPSLLHHPLPPARQSCISTISKKTFSRPETEAFIQSVRDKQQVASEATAKSPFKSSAPIVKDSPFGQKVMIQNRNSIYGDYQIYPLSSPAISTPRMSMYRDQMSSPAVMASAHKSLLSDMHKSVKWADVLTSYSNYSPCAVPKIKEKRVLFTTIDEIDNDIDDCKENIEPSLQNNVSDKNEHRNDVTTTAATDGHRENDSSCVATASYNSVSMTHSKLVEPRVQHSANSIQGCKLGSNNGQDSAATKSLGARRIPITGNRHDSDKQNCVSVTPFEKNRTVYKSIETPLHHVGISSLPKQGGTDNVNLQNWHSTANLKGVQVSVELDNDCSDSLKSQDQGKVVPHEKIKKTEMAMHTDEKEEKEDSDGVSSASKTVKTRSTPDNESVDKFVGRIKKSQKRQSIVELNESIVESQAHMHKLQVETEKLQDVAEVQEAEGSQTNMNILRQLELIAKQQEQLQVLQKQLQEQLSSLQTKATQVSGSNNNVEQQGEGHVTVHQQTEGHLSGIKDVVNVNTCSENILNNNMSETLTVDNQNISKTVSLFVSSSSAISQTLSHSRTWSPSKDLALTPSKRQPHVAIESTLNITPYATRKLPQNVDTSSKFCFEQIRNPTPVKREGGSCVTSLFPAVSPLWTPMAFKEVSQDQQNLAMTFDLCDNDIKTCTSQVAAIDLSVKRPKAHDDSDFQDDTVLPESPSYQQTFTPISAFTRLGSPDRNVGQLSLRANTASTPVDLSAKKKRLSLRRTVISSTNERYQEALLDEECALYSCRLQTPGHSGRGYVNPIARMLLDGDDMHFIPIREDSPARHYIREGSAFSCYSP